MLLLFALHICLLLSFPKQFARLTTELITVHIVWSASQDNRPLDR
jgi:hypothetical protein